jgi:hypothetical protein
MLLISSGKEALMIYESQQQAFDEMEVRIFCEGEEGYLAEISLTDDKASCRLPNPEIESLKQESDPRLLGIRLFEWLFRDEILAKFHRARWSTEMYSRAAGPVSGIRFRLWIDPKAEALHSLWWEALHDPTRDEPLSLDLAFSRFLRVKAPRGWPISERPLKMLLVASNPQGLERFGVTPIDVSRESDIIKKATGSVQQFITLDDRPVVPTPDNLRSLLGFGYHIVHILAHATVLDGRGCLILADNDAKAYAVPFEDVAKALAQSTREAPYFVFLSTPLSAGDQAGETMVRFAPILLEAGIQAVVAVQAPIGDERLWLFTERFYNILIRTGVIDMAMSEARARLYSPGDWEWAYPVLYMRTPDAQLFHPLSDSLEATVQNIRQSSST